MRRFHPSSATSGTCRSGIALAVLVAATAGGALAASPTVRAGFTGSFDPARLKMCRWVEGQPAANLRFEELIRESVESHIGRKGVEIVEGQTGCALRTRVVRSPAFPVAVLVVEVLDVGSQQVVWRGEASGLTEYPLAKIEKIVAKSIKKMFKRFPQVD